MTGPEAKGTLFVQLQVERRFALSVLTEGWTADEIVGLLAGEEEAYDALKDEATAQALKDADDVELNFCDFRINGEQKDL